MTPFVVLVVDDDASLRTSLAYAIGTVDGVRVLTAKDGEQALQTVAEDPPGLVLCDLGLPEMDGYETCRQIRAQHHDAHIWFITGQPMKVDEEEADRIGARGFLMKPFGVSQLREVVAEAMGSLAAGKP